MNQIKALWEATEFVYEWLCIFLKTFFMDDIKELYGKAIIAVIAIIIYFLINRSIGNGVSERTDNQKPKEWYENKE